MRFSISIVVPAAALLGCATVLPAAAQDVYKCKNASGELSYQDHPCDGGSKDAGLVKGGYVAPVGGGEAAAHYQNYLNQADQNNAQQQAERSRMEAEERRRQAEPPATQADQDDYRRHICQAQLDNQLTGNHLATFSCDEHGNKIPVQPAVVIQR